MRCQPARPRRRTPVRTASLTTPERDGLPVRGQRRLCGVTTPQTPAGRRLSDLPDRSQLPAAGRTPPRRWNRSAVLFDADRGDRPLGGREPHATRCHVTERLDTIPITCCLVAFNAEGGMLATGSAAGTIMLWEIRVGGYSESSTGTRNRSLLSPSIRVARSWPVRASAALSGCGMWPLATPSRFSRPYRSGAISLVFP